MLHVMGNTPLEPKIECFAPLPEPVASTAHAFGAVSHGRDGPDGSSTTGQPRAFGTDEPAAPAARIRDSRPAAASEAQDESSSYGDAYGEDGKNQVIGGGCADGSRSSISARTLVLSPVTADGAADCGSLELELPRGFLV
jgi:hypothetical protein